MQTISIAADATAVDLSHNKMWLILLFLPFFMPYFGSYRFFFFFLGMENFSVFHISISKCRNSAEFMSSFYQKQYSRMFCCAIALASIQFDIVVYRTYEQTQFSLHIVS